MIQGEVTVPYTPIGGGNMEYDIMPLDLSGSSINSDIQGAENFRYNIYWTLPGGITNQGTLSGNPGLAWAYIIGRQVQNQILYTDKLFCDYLETTYGYQFDESCNPKNPAQEISIKQTINDLVYEYVGRVLDNDGLEEGYDWGTMNRTYHTCMSKISQ